MNIFNRTFLRVMLLGLLATSSIPNLLANTNPDSNQAESVVLAEQARSTEKTADSGTQDTADVKQPTPFEQHLIVTANICSELLTRLENNTLIVSQLELLKTELIDVGRFAVQLIDDAKVNELDLKKQVIIENILQVSLARITELVQDRGRRLSDLDIDATIERIKKSTPTEDDLQSAMITTDQKLNKLILLINEKSKSGLDRTSDNALKQLCTVDMVLEELAQYIDNQSLKVTNKRDAIDQIRAIRGLIESIKNDRNEADEKRIKQTLSLNKLLMEHIRTMLKNKFTNIPELDIDSIATRSETAITIEELEVLYKENEQLLEALRKDSQGAGLTWYNRAARATQEAWRSLHGTDRTLMIGTTLFALSVVAQQYNKLPKCIENAKIPFANIKIYGEKAIFGEGKDSNGNTIHQVINYNNMGIVSYLVELFRSQILNNPMVAVPTGVACGFWAQEYTRAKNFSSNYWNKLTNFILGRKDEPPTDRMTRIEPKYTFNDIIGQDEIKETLNKLVRYLEDPQSIDNRGLKLERGYLFTGKTRSGKSFMAEALGGEIKAMFERTGRNKNSFNFFVVPAELLRQPGGFRMIMHEARLYAPCILFIDEIHLLGLQAGQNNALLGEFLTELSGCLTDDPKSKVFIIAATNQEDKIDKALRQSGRLGKEIRFDYPTFFDRKEFIMNTLEKRSVNLNTIDVNKFARESEGCTYEDLSKTIEDAFITAKFNVETIAQKHIDQSFDKNIRGIIFNYDRELSNEERRMIATHQAGYVLATKLLMPRHTIAQVTTLPIRQGIKERAIFSQYMEAKDDGAEERIIHGRLFTYRLNKNNALSTAQEQIGTCTTLLAGYTAGNVILGQLNNSTSYQAEHRQEAFEIAKKVVTNGVEIGNLDDALKNEYYKRALAFRNACSKKATALMEQNRDALEALANTLYEYETLSGKDVDAILSQFKLITPEQDDTILEIVNNEYADPVM